MSFPSYSVRLYSLPPFCVYAYSHNAVLLISTYSDRAQTRGLPVASVFCIAIVGWALLYGISPVHASASALRARYFGCICVVTAGCASLPSLPPN